MTVCFSQRRSNHMMASEPVDEYGESIAVLNAAVAESPACFPGITPDVAQKADTLLSSLTGDQVAESGIMAIIQAAGLMIENYIKTASFKGTMVQLLQELSGWLGQTGVENEPVARAALLVLLLQKKAISKDNLKIVAEAVVVVEDVEIVAKKVGCFALCC